MWGEVRGMIDVVSGEYKIKADSVARGRSFFRRDLPRNKLGVSFSFYGNTQWISRRAWWGIINFVKYPFAISVVSLLFARYFTLKALKRAVSSQ